VIVIGAGMGGLSAAAFLAKAGKKVLVIERHDVPGGYAHAFRRKKYVFDAAVHLTSGCEKGGLIDSILRMLNTRDQCEFLKVDPFYSAIFPGMKFQAPAAAEAFCEAHCESFPGDAKGFRKLFKEMAGLFGEVTTLPPDMGIMDMIQMPRKFPRVMKYHKATVGQVIDQHLNDPRSKAVFTTLWPYLGLPPSRLSFLYFTTMLFSYLRDGTYYAKKPPTNIITSVGRLEA
ncbi:MAG: NAD(P)/FAD-dependent oxidoreductase, partial [bacterium]|nr:NAD(P)/FAD-dependent oxidoreductase [bacterium]